MRKTMIRTVRKTAHLTHQASAWAAHFSQRVENKTSRILSGTDSSFRVVSSIPFEKLYYQQVPEIIPVHPALPQRGRKPAVVLLLPSLQNSSFFGGTSTAIIAAAEIAHKEKLDLRIIETLSHGGSKTDVVKDLLKKFNVPFAGTITQIDITARAFNVYGYIDMHPDDIFMASAWWDAYVLDKLPLKRKFIYLIQDYEPIFYANSDKYALAESTYHSQKYVALCNTKLMYDFMVNRGYTEVKNGTYFEPAVSYDVSKQKKKHEGKRRMFIYGRPNVERNLFFSAFSGLDMSLRNGFIEAADWEFFMAGQDNVPDLELSSGVVVKNLGKMDFAEYQEFVGTVDVAVSLMMAPHPNYPTLEFASTGAAIVTTRYDIKQDLSQYSKNIFMADITPESIAGGIRAAAELDAETRAKNAASSQVPNDWNKTLDKPLDATIKKLAKLTN